MPEWHPTDLLDKHEAATYLGISIHTWRHQVYERKTAPPPDGKKSNRLAWHPQTLDAWRAAHPTRERNHAN
jgi:predicted DNA-binding transcriptional regulator AlpA